MEVAGYRIYYIDEMTTSDGLVNLVRNSSAKKIALVVPENQLIFVENYNLKLLKTFMDRTNKEVVFINCCKEILENLSEAGFTVYTDLNHLEVNKNYTINQNNKNHKAKINRKFNKQKIMMIIAMFLIIVLAGFYFLYPTAVIEVEPVVNIKEEDIKIKGSLENDMIDWNNKIVPLHKFQIELSSSEQINASGKKLLAKDYAEGSVKFINENKEDIFIPAGTVVMTDNNIKFLTISDLKIPPLEIDYLMNLPVGMRAGQATVKIKASKRGSNSNVDIGKINIIDKNINNVYVINSEPTRGGTNEEQIFVSNKDIIRLKEQLYKNSRQQIIAKIYKKMGGNYYVIEDELKFSDMTYKINGKVGEIKRKLSGTGIMTASGYLLKNNEIDRLTTNIVKNKIKEEELFLNCGINIDEIKLEKINDKIYNIKLNLRAGVVPNLEKIELADNLAGKTVKKASSLLSNNQYIKSFTIKGNREILPHLKYAIKIVIAEPKPISVFNNIPAE